MNSLNYCYLFCSYVYIIYTLFTFTRFKQTNKKIEIVRIHSFLEILLLPIIITEVFIEAIIKDIGAHRDFCLVRENSHYGQYKMDAQLTPLDHNKNAFKKGITILQKMFPI